MQPSSDFGRYQRMNTYTCANLACENPLGVGSVLLITATHARQFCSVACIAAGQANAYRAVDRELDPDALIDARERAAQLKE